MAVLSTSEYDALYFEGAENTLAHNAGYSSYRRLNVKTKGLFSDRNVSIEDSTGNYYGDLCKSLNINLNSRFVGKRLLVIGSAYGYEVAQFRALGIDAYGIDVSQYAYDQADPAIQPYLIVGDIRTAILSMGRNGYDYIFSRWFIECMSDDDLEVGTYAGKPLLTELTRVCKSGQVHITNPNSNPVYYNSKPLTEWQAMNWETGTILVANDDFSNYVTVI